MKFKMQLVVVDNQGQEADPATLAVLEKQYQHVEQIGLTLAESKAILREIQRHVVGEQVAAFVRGRATCEHCGAVHSTKGHHTITFRTLFGNIPVESPRLWRCSCRPHDTATFSPVAELLRERTAPELSFMETRWASLVSYGMSVKALKDFLPIGEKLNAATVRNHTLKVARRSEAELGDEQVFFIEGCPRDWDALPRPEGPITAGIDGGYLRNWEDKKTNFEVIVGKSVPTDRAAKCFGFVQTYDEKPKRRVFEVLRSQGLQMNQEVYFMSDGEKELQRLQHYLNPRAKHILDWFHITMRITVLRQFAKGLVHLDAELGDDIDHALERTKWFLWHGKVTAALGAFEDVEDDMYNFEATYPKFAALKKIVEEFRGYIERNRGMIQNYGQLWREGNLISTAFIESLVNSLLGKRFTKKQQMQWTHGGAHLLLQTRTKTINGELAAMFQRWFPALVANDSEEREPAAAAA